MATITKGKTFISGETVEPADLHQLVDSATVTGIVNADIDAAAAIAASKLALTGAITNADINASAAIAYSKLNLSNSIVAGDITSSAVTPAKLSQPFTLATAQASTSGTSIDFTGIPSWAKRITVMFSGLSTNGTSVPLIQLGDAGGIETSGYLGAAGYSGSNTSSTNYTTGFGLSAFVNVSRVHHGAAQLCLIGAASNLWSYSMTGAYSDIAYIIMGGGSKSLSDTLTQVRITTVNGTDTFDAGTINIAYEG